MLKGSKKSQEALKLDNCQKWVHWLRGTGLTQAQYCSINKHLRDGGKFDWLCPACSKKKAEGCHLAAKPLWSLNRQSSKAKSYFIDVLTPVHVTTCHFCSRVYWSLPTYCEQPLLPALPSVPWDTKNKTVFIVQFTFDAVTQRANHADDCGVWNPENSKATYTQHSLKCGCEVDVIGRKWLHGTVA